MKDKEIKRVVDEFLMELIRKLIHLSPLNEIQVTLVKATMTNIFLEGISEGLKMSLKIVSPKEEEKGGEVK